MCSRNPWIIFFRCKNFFFKVQRGISNVLYYWAVMYQFMHVLSSQIFYIFIILYFIDLCTLKPWYNEPQYSEICYIVNKTQLPFWGLTEHITFDIVNKKRVTDLFTISRFECTHFWQKCKTTFPASYQKLLIHQAGR